MLRADGSWDCQLRLFLSVDIAGSTKYKNSRTDQDVYPPFWKDLFSSLYQDFYPLLIERINEGRKDNSIAERVESWKTIGDEVVFSIKIENETDAYDIISGFLTALREFDNEIMLNYPVRIKGSAWTAGFPIRNSIVLPFGRDINDYIGPDIDIGFRLGHYSKPSRTVISLDLADILSRERTPGSLNFDHVGWTVLKGVFDDQPYPVIWINDGKHGIIPPWDKDDDPFTRKMEKRKSARTKKQVQNLVLEIRHALPRLRLFSPYFCENDMPEYHRVIVEKQKEKKTCPDDPLGIPRPLDLD